jgi:hypothetical protein
MLPGAFLALVVLMSLKLLGFGLLAVSFMGCVEQTGASPSRPSTMDLESEPYACIESCASPRRLLSQSEVHVVATVSGSEAAHPPSARSNDALVATVAEQFLTCTCAAGGVRVAVEAHEACIAVDSKECSYAIQLQTHGPGEAVIELAMPDGTVVDRFPIAVRDAVRIAPVVRANGPKQTRSGHVLVYRDEPIVVAPYPEDQDGQRLAHHAPVTRLVSSESAVVAVVGTDGVRADALALGTSTLTVSLGAHSASVVIDVVGR